MRTMRGNRAFTLLEIMIAVTIMALISLAVMQVFRTGTVTYKFGNRDAMVLQRARYVFDSFEKDVKSVYYLDEDEYNEELTQEIERFQEDLIKKQEGELSNREWDDLYGPDGEFGDPFDQGVLIDLQFFGEDHGEKDSITFARSYPSEIGSTYVPWGLARIHYTVDGDFLIRTVETVEANPRDVDSEGVIIHEKEEKPTHSIVARGIEVFDLSYGFWSDGQWFESTQWTSSSKSYRNPNHLLGDYDDEDYQRVGENNVRDNDSDDSDELDDRFDSDPEQESYDGPPAYVRMRIVISDPENPGRKTELARIFRVPISMETWTVNERLEEDERDMELDIRTQDFTPVYPGAMRKRG